ncbi:hypothetical protein HPB51_021697 [Rhipicephalus microplus]|uniref:Endonuclease/exonuclease/phosphatase domain-containing protein n=1 Tax=Rhipicephalus microplus TaxID=6941 RepID=A0A9J6D732_RHIMP|nr:hypothetical protein HPB51_021697 [Rhipicephalus microplus]
MWMTGDLMGIPSAVCVVYMAVPGAHYVKNERLLECVFEHAECLAGCREVLILGVFNGHISELDRYTDANGKLLSQLSERLQLEIFNNIPRCEGQTTTWCARKSATSIDYALASDGLVKALQRLHIDAEGTHRIGSDHNRLRLDFSQAYHREPNAERRGTPNRYLPGVSLQTVVEQFEVSPKSEAKTYEEYVSELCRNIEMHKVCGGTRPARHHRKTWWDKEVAVARHARREANRSHRRAVRTKDAVQTEVAWQRYLQFKRDMQAH